MKKILLLPILLLILVVVPIANAVDIYWITPDQNGIYIPQDKVELRWYITDADGINNCTINTDGIISQIDINGDISAEISNNIIVAEGTHNTALECIDTLGNSVSENKTFKTDSIVNVNEQNRQSTEITIFVIAGVLIIITYIGVRDKIIRKIAAMLFLIITIYAQIRLDYDIIIIPLILAIIIVIRELFTWK